MRVSILHLGTIIRDNSPVSLIEELGKWCRVSTGEKGRKIDFFTERSSASENSDDDLSQLVIRRTTLEDLFIHLTGKGLD